VIELMKDGILNSNRKTVFLIGASDVDARIDLVRKFPDNYDPTVIGSSKSLHRKFKQANIDYYTYPLGTNFTTINTLYSMFALYKIFKLTHPIIIHAFDTRPCIIARLAALAAKVPVIIGTQPGLGELYSANGLMISFYRKIFQIINKFVFQTSSTTILQNHDDQHDLIESGVGNIKNTHVILSSGINTSEPQKMSSLRLQEVRDHFNIPTGFSVVTCATRVRRSKGVLQYCELSNILKESNIIFLLVGEYEEVKGDRLTDEELNFIKNSVSWVGYQDNVENILGITDVLVHPTRYREGVPRILLEASRHQIPVIATDMPGCREVILNGVTGILVKPYDVQNMADQLNAMLASSEARKRIGHSLKEHVKKNFSLDKVSSEIIGVYEHHSRY
jgi:glycosyltransferase involved in cell wall biosynthesis